MTDPHIPQRLGLAILFHSARMILCRPCLCRFEGRILNQSTKSKDFNQQAVSTCVHSARTMISLLSWTASPIQRIYSIPPWWHTLHYLCEALSALHARNGIPSPPPPRGSSRNPLRRQKRHSLATWHGRNKCQRQKSMGNIRLSDPSRRPNNKLQRLRYAFRSPHPSRLQLAPLQHHPLHCAPKSALWIESPELWGCAGEGRGDKSWRPPHGMNSRINIVLIRGLMSLAFCIMEEGSRRRLIRWIEGVRCRILGV